MAKAAKKEAAHMMSAAEAAKMMSTGKHMMEKGKEMMAKAKNSSARLTIKGKK